MFTVAGVALVTVTVLMGMSPPKMRSVSPAEVGALAGDASWRFDLPCWALLGVSDCSAAGPAVTAKALFTTSVPVVTSPSVHL